MQCIICKLQCNAFYQDPLAVFCHFLKDSVLCGSFYRYFFSWHAMLPCLNDHFVNPFAAVCKGRRLFTRSRQMQSSNIVILFVLVCHLLCFSYFVCNFMTGIFVCICRDSSPNSVPDSVTDSTGSRTSYLVMNTQGETTPSPVIPNTYLSLPQNVLSNSLTECKSACVHGQEMACGFNTELCDMCRSLPCALCKAGTKNKQDVVHSVRSLKDLTSSQPNGEIKKNRQGRKNGYLDISAVEVKQSSVDQACVLITT